MKLNLRFERVDEKSHIKETKIVPIDIPELIEEDWYLEGSSQVVTYTKPIVVHPTNNDVNQDNNKTISNGCLENTSISLHPSQIVNNKKTLKYVASKLYRKDDFISLAYIQPNQTMNFNTIFITPEETIDFFNDMVFLFGARTTNYKVYCYHKDIYDKWDAFMKKRHQEVSQNLLEILEIKYDQRRSKKK